MSIKVITEATGPGNRALSLSRCPPGTGPRRCLWFCTEALGGRFWPAPRPRSRGGERRLADETRLLQAGAGTVCFKGHTTSSKCGTNVGVSSGRVWPGVGTSSRVQRMAPSLEPGPFQKPLPAPAGGLRGRGPGGATHGHHVQTGRTGDQGPEPARGPAQSLRTHPTLMRGGGTGSTVSVEDGAHPAWDLTRPLPARTPRLCLVF